MMVCTVLSQSFEKAVSLLSVSGWMRGCSLSEYLLFHYSSEAQVLPASFGAEVEGIKNALDFPLRCVERLVDKSTIDHASAKAYDLGCAVGYDLSRQFIHAANLLCRLRTPERFLDVLPLLIKPGGQLLLVTPVTWLEAFTPAHAWPADWQGKPLQSDIWPDGKLGDSSNENIARTFPF